MSISIDEILSIPFRNRCYEEQLQIVMEGKPSLSNMQNSPKNQNCKRYICVTECDSVAWLMRCTKRNKLFCWPCVLFESDKSAWNNDGYSEFRNLQNSIQTHEKTVAHMKAVLDLHAFSKNIKVPVIRDCVNQTDIAKQNYVVGKNREILKRIIDVIFYMIGKEQPPSSEINRSVKPLMQNCVELLQLMKICDPPFVKHTEDAIALLQSSPSCFNDMIHSMTDVVTNAIKNEIREVSQVSLILNETSDISAKSQISTIIRYVKDAKIFERFLGFTNIVEYKSSDVLFKHILKVVNEYGLSEKLVSQSYDGSVTSNKHLKDLVQMVRTTFPHVIFVPCYSHDFEKVLQQGLSHIRECEIFFRTLNGIGLYFSENLKRRRVLEAFMVEKLPRLRNIGCYIKPQDIFTVTKHRREFLEFFEMLIENSEKWNTDDIVKARGYLEFLTEFLSMFLLQIFSNLFTFTKTLSSALKSEMPETAFNLKELHEMKSNIINYRENGFENVWVTVVAESLSLEESKPKRLKLELEEESKLRYRELFYKIIDYILQQIELRCSSLHKLEFFNLLNHQYYDTYCENFPELQFQKLITAYALRFDSVRLLNELKVMFVHSLFAGKKIEEILEFLVQEKMASSFSEISKLAELILTLPCKTAEVSCASSTMKTFNAWSYVSDIQDATRVSWTFLCVEKKILSNLKCCDSFYNKVLNEFDKKTGSMMELMYK